MLTLPQSIFLVSYLALRETFPFLGKYFGVSIMNKIERPKDFQYLVDIVKSKISTWKAVVIC